MEALSYAYAGAAFVLAMLLWPDDGGALADREALKRNLAVPNAKRPPPFSGIVMFQVAGTVLAVFGGNALTGNLVAGAILGVFGWIMPGLIADIRREGPNKRYAAQAESLISSLEAAMRAGKNEPAVAAMKRLAEAMPEPIRDDLRRVLADETEEGRLAPALRRLAERRRSPDLESLAAAVDLAETYGGDLRGALGPLARRARARSAERARYAGETLGKRLELLLATAIPLLIYWMVESRVPMLAGYLRYTAAGQFGVDFLAASMAASAGIARFYLALPEIVAGRVDPPRLPRLKLPSLDFLLPPALADQKALRRRQPGKPANFSGLSQNLGSFNDPDVRQALAAFGVDEGLFLLGRLLLFLPSFGAAVWCYFHGDWWATAFLLGVGIYLPPYAVRGIWWVRRQMVAGGLPRFLTLLRMYLEANLPLGEAVRSVLGFVRGPLGEAATRLAADLEENAPEVALESFRRRLGVPEADALVEALVAAYRDGGIGGVLGALAEQAEEVLAASQRGASTAMPMVFTAVLVVPLFASAFVFGLPMIRLVTQVLSGATHVIP